MPAKPWLDRAEAGLFQQPDLEKGLSLGPIARDVADIVFSVVHGGRMTRRGLLGPLMAGPSLLALGACAGGMGLGPRLGPKSVRMMAAAAAYGPHPRQTMDVYGRGDHEAPVVVIFGAAPDIDDTAAPALAMMLAERGCLAIHARYPLNAAGRFAAQAADGALALTKVIDMAGAWGGDVKRLGVAGLSAGAWLAAMLALDRRYLAGAGRRNAIDVAACLGGPYDFIALDEGSGSDAFGRGEDLTFTRPTAYVRPDAAPLWLGHGLDDRLAPPEHAQRLHVRMQAVAGTSVLKLYPALDHVKSLRSPEVLTDMAAFLMERL